MVNIQKITTLSYNDDKIDYEILLSDQTRIIVSVVNLSKPRYPQIRKLPKAIASFIWYPGWDRDDDDWKFIDEFHSLDDFISNFIALTRGAYQREDQPERGK